MKFKLKARKNFTAKGFARFATDATHYEGETFLVTSDKHPAELEELVRGLERDGFVEIVGSHETGKSSAGDAPKRRGRPPKQKTSEV